MKPSDNSLSRREFAKRAALGTAAAIAPAYPEWTDGTRRAALEPSPASPTQLPEASKLSPQSQAEAASRYQAILAQYPDRFSDVQKTDLRRLCFVTQEPLDKLRAWSVANSDQPALYLKPLVERAKKTNAPPNLKAAPTKPAATSPSTTAKPVAPAKPTRKP